MSGQVLVISLMLLVLIQHSSTKGISVYELINEDPELVTESLERLAETLHKPECMAILQNTLNNNFTDENIKEKRSISAILTTIKLLGGASSILKNLPQLIQTSKECWRESKEKREIRVKRENSFVSFFKKAFNKVKTVFKKAWNKVKTTVIGWFTSSSESGKKTSNLRERLDDFLVTTKKGMKRMFNFGVCMTKKNLGNGLLLRAIEVLGNKIING